MAESESAHGNGNQTKDWKRKQNFSVYEIIEIITDNVKKNLDLIQSKLTNAVTNKKKQMLWEEITQAVNAVGTAKRTVTEVKDKWKNLHSIAKKEFAEFKREIKVTDVSRNDPCQINSHSVYLWPLSNLQYYLKLIFINP